MPIFSLVLIVVIVVAVTIGLATRSVTVRTRLTSLSFWAAIGGLSLSCCVASALIRSTAYSGTGRRSDHGWPKAFYFEWVSDQDGHAVDWVNYLHLIGDFTFYSAMLVATCALWRFVMDRRFL